MKSLEIEVVCGVIANVAGELLACQRPLAKHLGGLWEFPGGKIEAGELAAAALVRELLEELNVVVEVGQPLTPVNWDDPAVRILLRPYHCTILRGKLQLHEHIALRWGTIRQLKDLPWAPADLPIVQELLRL